MTEVRYVPADMGELVAAEDLAPGTLGYVAGQTQPIVCLDLGAEERGWLELGGERSLTIWNARDEEGAVWTVPEWRLEVDPTSMIDARYASLMKGYAFRHGDRSGVIGQYDRNRAVGTYLPVGTDGRSTPLQAGECKVFFSRWRIVTTTSDSDRILVDDEGKAQPR